MTNASDLFASGTKVRVIIDAVSRGEWMKTGNLQVVTDDGTEYIVKPEWCEPIVDYEIVGERGPELSEGDGS